jgi:hypothetical protein
MSDYDQQLADQVQMQFELDEVFKDLEEGVLLTVRQIDLLRHCCGYVAPKRNDHVNPLLRDVINDFGNCFGNPLNTFPTIWSKK